MTTGKRHLSRKSMLLLLIPILIILITCIIWLTWPHHQKLMSARKIEATSKTLTAGGLTVPPQFQAKARSLGYYCPSWNSGPGQASSGICMPLDK